MSTLISHRGAYIHEYCIAEEMAKINDGITIDKNDRGFIAGEAAFSCIGFHQQEDYRRAAERVASFLCNREPSLSERHYKVAIPYKSFPRDQNDERSFILSDDNGKEIGLLTKFYSHAMRHCSMNTPRAVLDNVFNIQDDAEIFMDGFRELEVTGDEWLQKKDEIMRNYLDLMRNLIHYAYESHPELPKLLIQRQIGNHDYYFIDINERRRNIQICSFNMNGTLAATHIPYPTELIDVQNGNYTTGSFKNNMLTLIFNGGWMVTMRLHLASLARKQTKVSIKIDVSLKGHPYKMDEEVIDY